MSAIDGERFTRADFQYQLESWGRCIGLGRLGTLALASCRRVRRCNPLFGRHLDDVSQAVEGDAFHGLASMAQVEWSIGRAGDGQGAKRIAGDLP